HRPGRRPRRDRGAGIRQPQGDRGRDESADDSIRAPLRRTCRPSVRPTRRGSHSERGPQFHQPNGSQVRHDLSPLRRLLGVGSVGGGGVLSAAGCSLAATFRNTDQSLPASANPPVDTAGPGILGGGSNSPPLGTSAPSTPGAGPAPNGVGGGRGGRAKNPFPP